MVLLLAVSALAARGFSGGWAEKAIDAPARQVVEAAFSPDDGAEALVTKAIRAANSDVRVAAYSFTSSPIARALIAAKKRGVRVSVLVDYKSNVEETRNEASKRALGALVSADIPVRTIDVYPIHHDKYMVIDTQHVETGSYNYTNAAEKSNSENVVVVWNNPALAKQYLVHWQTRWDMGKDFKIAY